MHAIDPILVLRITFQKFNVMDLKKSKFGNLALMADLDFQYQQIYEFLDLDYVKIDSWILKSSL